MMSLFVEILMIDRPNTVLMFLFMEQLQRLLAVKAI